MEIKIKGLDETITYEKLDNGLEVYLYNKKTFHNNYVTFTTKFGSINTEFFDKTTNKKIQVPSGIAHFLEHTKSLLKKPVPNQVTTSLPTEP